MLDTVISPATSDDALVRQHRYTSGISVVWTQRGDTATFCQSLGEVARAGHFAVAVLYFSPTTHSAHELVDLLSTHAPGLPYSGCSTCGEISPDGMQTEGIMAVLLPAQWFTVHLAVIENIDTLGVQQIAEHAAAERVRFEHMKRPSSDNQADSFAITLIDGLTYSEEATTSAVHRGLDGMPLIGGSAGDDLEFRRTIQLCSGRQYQRSVVLMLVQSRLPFELYTENNFVPTSHKLVVTESDPDLRNVKEFNAEPAALAYANAIGKRRDDLDATSFASHALVVRVGGEHYCRSIQRVNDDQSLTFYCAIDDGLVLTVARSEGMVRSTQAAIDRVKHAIGPIDMMFGFDCIYRRLDAEHRGAKTRMNTLYSDQRFIGFNTYGEQFNAMHINQTFTGVAFGQPQVRS